MASVAIVNREKGALRPNYVVEAFIVWFYYVKYNGDPVFIVRSKNALICVRGIRRYDSVFLLRVLWAVEIG